MLLHPKLTEELLARHRDMRAKGELLSRERLDHFYGLFRSQFGPDRLSELDGRALLYTLHAFSTSHRDSVAYWLEFKNDDEFPTIEFGSIAGGSALKFGIYQRKEDGVWVTGGSKVPQELTEEEAIDVARQHRYQLLRGTELLEALPVGADDEAYRLLQEAMDAAAPLIADTAWGHKYFHILFPDKLDDFHVKYYQRFHLTKLLQVPPGGPGRFVCGGRFVAIADELGMPVNHLTSILNERNGRPYRYWRVGTSPAGSEQQEIWNLMFQENNVAVGWPKMGDLSYVSYDLASKQALREALAREYPTDPRQIGRQNQQLFDFVVRIGEGDIVLPSDGRRVLGIGRVTGPYEYVAGSPVPHRRPVEWIAIGEWPMPQSEGLRTTVAPIRKHDENLVEVERKILEAGPVVIPPRPPGTPVQAKLTGIPGQIQAILQRKKQVILYGPPGTGKTFWARRAAQELAAYARFGRSFADLSDGEQQSLFAGASAPIRMCTFHPAYGYEDFLEGYRPEVIGDQLVFARRDGIFKKLCRDAAAQPQQNFYLIIDEINRGDIPRIFGELLTVLEADKRNQEILLPLSAEPFSVPANVYLIATMNTADRSIALLDTALRRRFGFIELMPDTSVLEGAVVENTIPLGPWLAALNQRILEHIGRDARNLQIGHAYLLHEGRPVTDSSRFVRVLREDVIPLLQEYCYEDYSALVQILGNSLVDVEHQRIRQELFSSEKRDELLQALLEPAPHLAASAEVVASEAESEELAEEEAIQEDEEPVG